MIKELHHFNYRLLFLLSLLFLAMFILIWRLYVVQIKGGDEHRESIRSQSIRRIRIPSVRGRIISSDGQYFADNRVKYDTYIHIHELRKRTKAGTIEYVLEKIQELADLIGRDHTFTKEKVDKHIRQYPALPFRLFENLQEDELARLTEQMPAIPGLELTTDYMRIYPQNELGAHLIGYVNKRVYGGSKPRPGDLSRDDIRYAYYFYPEQIGRNGLEKVFNQDLSGEVGFRVVRVDSMGYYHDQLEQEHDKKHGLDLHLTLDARAQRIAQRLLAGKLGSLVMLDVNTGAVKAMVSNPSFDLNRVRYDYGKHLKNPSRPLVNRSITADYLPGSILKPILGLGLLQEGLHTENSEYDCLGYYKIGNREIDCHLHSGHGNLSLTTALEDSCNPYFIDGGIRMGVDKLHDLYKSAGVGVKPGLELDNRYSAGIVPGRGEMQLRQRRRWIMSDTAFVSIGQGFVSISPLQAAMFTAAVANGGKVYKPYLVAEKRNFQGTTIFKREPQLKSVLQIDAKHYSTVHQGMYDVVYGDIGTAKVVRSDLIKIAGKTGTAEVGPRSRRTKNTWFVGFGPFEKPEFAIAVLVENGVSGGKDAAPIAIRFIEEFLAQSKEKQAEK
ncbi:MAG: penicillin-binding protein 2 [Lentisphaeria bacterium]|nr:penicillin-binding protein 2 [Lentisphaeria bacterium]